MKNKRTKVSKTIQAPAAEALRRFPRSCLYSAILPPNRSPSVRERSLQHPFLWTERHLKALWFDPSHRPATLVSSEGEQIHVEDPGIWNLEAGPDFKGALLRIGPDKRCLQGDVEIHIKPRDWLEHKHYSDPAYSRVIAHVTWFPGSLPSSVLPAGAIQISLAEFFSSGPTGAFESIDVTAYPFAAWFDSVPRCAASMAALSVEERIRVLEAAGEERLLRKTQMFCDLAETKGAQQIFYEEIFAALGYKHNRSPFRQLATIVPYDVLLEEAGCDPLTAQAVLLGTAGLLPTKESTAWDNPTKTFVRNLWDRWWKMPSSLHSRKMPAERWRLSGVRPANMPQRRIAAAAILFSKTPPVFKTLLDIDMTNPKRWIAAASSIFSLKDSTGYWHRHATFGHRPFRCNVALIGRGRIVSILSNIVMPFLASCDKQVTYILRALPAEDDNATIRTMAFRLFGRDHNPALHRFALCQQGLIQIFNDFCLSSSSGCSTCAFPDSLHPFSRP